MKTRSRGKLPSPEAIRRCLAEEDPAALAPLFAEADALRMRHVGDAVWLRGLVELSNHCRRRCAYCGIAVGASRVPRYRLDRDGFLDCARRAHGLGYGTLVVQAGEDPGLDVEGLAEWIRSVKTNWGLAITLSLGERDLDELALWRAAGADRYFLRMETADAALYDHLHPDGSSWADRLALLVEARRMGYEIGSGIMVGLPGQDLDDLHHAVELFAELQLDMIGVGPYIPHPDSSLQRRIEDFPPASEPARATELQTLTVLALARMARPTANLPSTTALARVAPGTGRSGALGAGANVIMPNLTPAPYRRAYDIYPGKGSTEATDIETHRQLLASLAALGRFPGQGRGDSLSFLRNQATLEAQKEAQA